MKIVKNLLLGIVGLVAALAVIGLALPREVRIERSAVIAAPPATVFTYLNGWRNFNTWSPWASLDPDTRYTYEGPLVGVGAKQSWASDDARVGHGSQEITAVEPGHSITIKLQLPDMAPSVVTQTLTPEGEGTKIVWTMDADMGLNPLNRWFGLALDKLIGPDYEKGLANMKPLIEDLPKGDPGANAVTLVTTTALPLLVVSDSGSGAGDGAEVAAKLSAAYGRIGEWMKANGVELAAAPMAITRSYNEQTKVWDFDAAIAIDKPDAAPPAETGIQAVRSYAGQALRISHVGPYTAMEPAYAKLEVYKTVAGLEDNGPPWEQYIDDPTTKPLAEVRTDIYWPVK